MRDRIDLEKLASEYGVNNLRFFIPMRPTHSLFGFGIPLGYTSDSDEEEEVECFVDEERYKVTDGYKIILRSLNDERFTYDSFYQSDFENLQRAYPDLYRVYCLVDADNKYARLA